MKTFIDIKPSYWYMAVNNGQTIPRISQLEIHSVYQAVIGTGFTWQCGGIAQTKTYAVITGHCKVSDTKAGDKVLLKNLRPKKHEPVFSTDTYTILHRNGNHVEVERY